MNPARANDMMKKTTIKRASRSHRAVIQAAPDRGAGVTLTELLVVLLIVGLLSTIALPVYMNRAERARISTAEAECRQIAEAEEACAAVHTLYVAIQVLDDVAGSTADGLNSTRDDSIQFETSQYAIDPSRPVARLSVSQPLISTSSEDTRVRNMVRNWGGPFLNPQHIYTGTSDTVEPTNNESYIRRDYPLDPWGQPYRFYSPLGIIGSSATSTSPDSFDSTGFSDGVVTNNDQRFDRFAIVSFGPNGESNSNTADADDDDIIYFFGPITAQKETDYAPLPTAGL